VREGGGEGGWDEVNEERGLKKKRKKTGRKKEKYHQKREEGRKEEDKVCSIQLYSISHPPHQ